MGKNLQIAFCCSQFANAAQAKERQGLSISLQRDARLKLVVAFFEFRAFTEDDLAKLRNLHGIRVVTAHQGAILFCPWCGVDIRAFYASADLPAVSDPPINPFQEYSD
jgi:hypothetical protein